MHEKNRQTCIQTVTVTPQSFDTNRSSNGSDLSTVHVLAEEHTMHGMVAHQLVLYPSASCSFLQIMTWDTVFKFDGILGVTTLESMHRVLVSVSNKS